MIFAIKDKKIPSKKELPDRKVSDSLKGTTLFHLMMVKNLIIYLVRCPNKDS